MWSFFFVFFMSQLDCNTPTNLHSINEFNSHQICEASCQLWPYRALTPGTIKAAKAIAQFFLFGCWLHRALGALDMLWNQCMFYHCNIAVSIQIGWNLHLTSDLQLLHIMVARLLFVLRNTEVSLPRPNAIKHTTVISTVKCVFIPYQVFANCKAMVEKH